MVLFIVLVKFMGIFGYIYVLSQIYFEVRNTIKSTVQMFFKFAFVLIMFEGRRF